VIHASTADLNMQDTIIRITRMSEWKSCPYCINGTRLIEAGTVAVVEFLKQLPTRRRNDILRQFNDDKDV